MTGVGPELSTSREPQPGSHHSDVASRSRA